MSLDGDYSLKIVNGRESGKTVNLIGELIELGGGNTLEATEGRITLPDSSLAKVHAMIIWETRQKVYSISNRSFTRPIMVNGQPCAHAHLLPGFTFTIGNFEMAVEAAAGVEPGVTDVGFASCVQQNEISFLGEQVDHSNDRKPAWLRCGDQAGLNQSSQSMEDVTGYAEELQAKQQANVAAAQQSGGGYPPTSGSSGYPEQAQSAQPDYSQQVYTEEQLAVYIEQQAAAYVQQGYDPEQATAYAQQAAAYLQQQVAYAMQQGYTREQAVQYAQEQVAASAQQAQDYSQPSAAEAADTSEAQSEAEPETKLLGRLQVTKGANKGRSLEVIGNVTIGRSPECDFVLTDGQVSRRHCSIEFVNDEVYIVNHSTSGTTKVGKANVKTKSILEDACDITLANRVVLRWTRA